MHDLGGRRRLYAPRAESVALPELRVGYRMLITARCLFRAWEVEIRILLFSVPDGTCPWSLNR
jgi:hypothetical protein